MVFSSTFTIFAKRANMKQAIINKLREFFTLQLRKHGCLVLILVEKNQGRVILIYLYALTRMLMLLFSSISVLWTPYNLFCTRKLIWWKKDSWKISLKNRLNRIKYWSMREKPKDINRLSHIIEAIDNLFEVTKGISFDGYKGNKTLRLPLSKIYR